MAEQDKRTYKGVASFESGRGNTMEIIFLKVSNKVIINIYDDVETFSLTNTFSNKGFGTNVENNKKSLRGLITETGNYEIEINTKSGGIYNKEIEIKSLNTEIIFNKIDYDFEIIRVDENNDEIENEGINLLSTSFVSNDTIRVLFRESEGYDLVNDGFSYNDIEWEVKGVTVNDGTVNIQTSISNQNHAFIPSPINRPVLGSRNPNTAIRYSVEAIIIGLKKTINLEQDETDVLRQEYIDYNTIWRPNRDEIHLVPEGWNTGNYNYIATEGNNRFQEIWDELVQNYQNLCDEVGNVDNNQLTFNSCYRNPQRNRAVGSRLINSNHTRGHAMDISIIGRRTSQKWNFLHNAAELIEGVNAICEIGPTQVPCNNPNVSHVHIAW